MQIKCHLTISFMIKFQLVILTILTLTQNINSQNLNWSHTFDGISQFYKITNAGTHLETPQLTVEAWIKPQPISSEWKMIIGCIDYGGWAFYMQNNRLNFGRVNARDSLTQSSINILDNIWTHVAVSYDGTNIKFYINGILAENVPNKVWPINSNNGSYAIGQVVNIKEFYKGSVDEIRIWNTIRDQTQIKSNLNCELIGTEAGLILYYKFNETSGTIIEDATKYSHNALVQSGSVVFSSSAQVKCPLSLIRDNKLSEELFNFDQSTNKLSVLSNHNSSSIKICNTLGKVLYEINNQDCSTKSIDLSFLSAGMYFINNQKIIKF